MTGIIARAQAGVNEDTATSTYTVNKPTGTAAGDVLVAVIANVGAATFTPPSGWTSIETEAADSAVRIGAWYKVAGGSEPSSYAWSLSTTTKGFGWIGAYQNVDNTSPIDVSTDGNSTSTGSTTALATLVHANAWLVTAALGRHGFNAARSLSTSDASDTNRYTHGSSSASGFDYAGAVWDSARDLAAGSASRTLTVNAGTETGLSWLAIGLKPATSTVTGTASASLGALTGAAVGVRTVLATATASLGRLTAAAAGRVTRFGTAEATLGQLSGAAAGTRTVNGTAAAALGNLTGAAAGTRTTFGSAAADLPSPTGNAIGVRTVNGIATADLGVLTGHAVQFSKIVRRPDIGLVTRPDAGVVTRPNTGTVTRP